MLAKPSELAPLEKAKDKMLLFVVGKLTVADWAVLGVPAKEVWRVFVLSRYETLM